MAPRTTWKGMMHVGIIPVPLKLYKATEDEKVALHMAHDGCGGRIKYKYCCEQCGELMDSRPKSKVFESGESVAVLTPEDFDSLPLKSAKEVVVMGFTDKTIDPRLNNGLYYASPDKGGERPFGLIYRVMSDLGVSAIGKITMRGEREHLCAITPMDGVLLVQRLLYASEVRPYNELKSAPASLSAKEIELGTRLIESLKIDYNHSEHVDQYNNALKELVTAKLEGRAIAPVQEKPALPAGDLTALLEASLGGK